MVDILRKKTDFLPMGIFRSPPLSVQFRTGVRLSACDQRAPTNATVDEHRGRILDECNRVYARTRLKITLVLSFRLLLVCVSTNLLD